MSLKIAEKISLITVCVIVLFVSLSTFYFLKQEKRSLTFELDERINSLLSYLSIRSEYPVLIEDGEAISELGREILREKDIVFCEIKNREGVILFQEGSKKVEPLRQYTSAIVTIRNAEAGEGEELVLPGGRKVREQIGGIHLAVSPAGLNCRMSRVKQTIILACGVAVIFAILANSLFLGIFLGKPIDKLVVGTRKIAAGELGYKVPVRSKDEIGQLAISFNRMTDALQKSQDELVAAREYTDNIIESMIDSLIVTGGEGRIKNVNRATLDLLGYTEDELRRKPVEMLFEEKPFFHGKNFQEFIKRGYIRNMDMTYITKGGQTIPVSFSSSVMKDKEGNLAGIVSTVEDMRETKRLMEEMELSKDKMEKAYGELAKNTARLERFHKLTVGREKDMIHLEAEINSLLKELGRPIKYKTPEKTEDGAQKEKGDE